MPPNPLRVPFERDRRPSAVMAASPSGPPGKNVASKRKRAPRQAEDAVGDEAAASGGVPIGAPSFVEALCARH